MRKGASSGRTCILWLERFGLSATHVIARYKRNAINDFVENAFLSAWK